jgi:hypothetical protein
VRTSGPRRCESGTSLGETRGWNALADRLTNDSAVEAWDADDELVPMGLVTAIANPFGVEELDVALKRVDCPVAPELFRRTAF